MNIKIIKIRIERKNSIFFIFIILLDELNHLKTNGEIYHTNTALKINERIAEGTMRKKLDVIKLYPIVKSKTNEFSNPIT